MALTTADQQAIAAAQAAYPTLPPGLLSAIAIRESSGNPQATNASSGAEGLFQVLPSTAANPGYGVTPLANPYDPTQSAMFAGAYLTALSQGSGGLAGAVSQYSGGGYSLADLDVSGSTSQSAGLASTAGTAGTTAASTSAGNGTAASGWLSSGWEFLIRGGIIALGAVLILLALAALLWQSKGTRTVVQLAKAGAIAE